MTLAQVKPAAGPVVRNSVDVKAALSGLADQPLAEEGAVADRIAVLRRGRKVAEKAIADSSPEEVTGLITGAIETA